MASTWVGTRKYMSPEIMNCKKYTYTTDIWSTGCVIFELIILKKYFDYHSNKCNNDHTFEDLNITDSFKHLFNW